MRIHLCGASGEVTGSAYLVETGKARVLVDLGMFQGGRDADAKNNALGHIDPNRLDAVVLTHAHLDHCGRLPLLPKRAKPGFSARIHATPATIDLTELILRDSAHIQEADAARENRFRQREGGPEVTPLYTLADAEAVLARFAPLPLGEDREIAPGVSVRLTEAGHILGSASVVMTVRDGPATKTVVFSGDVGPCGVPITRDPVPPEQADLLFLESTYGDRDHRPLADTIAQFDRILGAAAWEKGRVLLPAFAVGRSQLLLHFIAELYGRGRVPRLPVYVDSPMANRASALYCKHSDVLDAAGPALCTIGSPMGAMSFAHALTTSTESRALNESWEPAVVIAASGMCDAGRILHHLKHNLWRKGVSVVMTGYQSEGSLGRRLIDGAPKVRILGQEVAVRAKVHTLGGFSAHAGQTGLIAWAAAMAAHKPRVVLTHGEDRGRAGLAAKLKERFGLIAELPGRGAVIDL
jgi:metallo-beta-lactamase family protein